MLCPSAREPEPLGERVKQRIWIGFSLVFGPRFPTDPLYEATNERHWVTRAGVCPNKVSVDNEVVLIRQSINPVCE
jgi:hypothetical protein